MKNFKFPRRSR